MLHVPFGEIFDAMSLLMMGIGSMPGDTPLAGRFTDGLHTIDFRVRKAIWYSPLGIQTCDYERRGQIVTLRTPHGNALVLTVKGNRLIGPGEMTLRRK